MQSQENIADWQIQQANEAVQLYTSHFHGRKAAEITDDQIKSTAGPFIPDRVLASIQEAIRAKHYSLSTERTYLDWAWQYVFPSSKLSVDPRSGIVRRHHLDESSIQKAVGTAARKAGIAKQVSVHTLRHSFATHLLINGVNIREIQTLLGQQNVATTMIYTK